MNLVIMILKIVNIILDNIDLIVDVAIDITLALIEGIFKALGRTLAKATAIDPRLGGEIPSTKGKI